MQYRREIDGLRAVAVLPVILDHAKFGAFSGGFVGVDVFFVISGFLITSIITEEIRGGRFSLLGFYERRVRRIIPALFLVMLVCLPPSYLFLLLSSCCPTRSRISDRASWRRPCSAIMSCWR